MYADLHLHSIFSDGTLTPEALVARAVALDISVLALTDHDTVDGSARMAAACAAAEIEFIPGCEFTAEHQGHELHILGYFLDVQDERLLTVLQKFQVIRRQRIYQMVSRLNELGVPLSVERVFELANCQAPGRPHIGRALIAEGHCASLDEAFQVYLKKGRPAWVAKDKLKAIEAIELIHQVGGLASMAHPGINHIDEIIPELAYAGLDGLECFYIRHSTVVTEHYLMLAEQHGLLVTGGSDCHGDNKGQPLMGSIKLPLEMVERLKSAAGVAH